MIDWKVCMKDIGTTTLHRTQPGIVLFFKLSGVALYRKQFS